MTAAWPVDGTCRIIIRCTVSGVYLSFSNTFTNVPICGKIST